MLNGRRNRTSGNSPKWRDRFLVLGTPAALSFTVIVASIPITALGPLVLDPQRIGLSFGQGLLIFFIGQLAMVPVFLLARSLVPRVPHRVSRTWATVLSLGIASVVRAVAMGASTYALGITNDIEFSYRVGTSFVIFAYLVIASSLVATDSEHRRLLADLRERRAELRAIDGSLRGQVAEVDAELAKVVRERLKPTVDRMDEAIDAAVRAEDRQESLDKLVLIIDEELRPLSHEMANHSDSHPAATRDAHGIADRRNEWTEQVFLGQVIRAWAGVSLLFLYLTSQAVRLMDYGERVQTALLWIVCFGLLLYVARRALWKVRVPTWLAIVVAGLVFSLGLGLVWLGAIALGSPWLPSAWIAGVVGEFVVGLMSASWTVLEMRRIEAKRYLETTIKRLELSTSLLRQQVWFSTRRLGLVLHGSLQSALLSAIMRISAGQVDERSVTEMKNHIGQALVGLNGGFVDSPDVPSVLANVVAVWEGVCDITCDISADLDRVLRASPSAREAVSVIVTEGVQNAVRHGGASRVHVFIESDVECVQVSIRDNGQLIEGREGLGSRLLDEVTLNWSRTTGPEGTLLCAAVVLTLQEQGFALMAGLDAPR